MKQQAEIGSRVLFHRLGVTRPAIVYEIGAGGEDRVHLVRFDENGTTPFMSVPYSEDASFTGWSWPPVAT